MTGIHEFETGHGESRTTDRRSGTGQDRRSGTGTDRGVRALWLAGVVALSLFALGAVPASAAAAGNDAVEHSSCTTITTEGEHVLSADITDATTTRCIEIQASNVTLDGNGYTVDGVDDGSTEGIYVNGPATNVTVTNVTVSDWETGVYLQESSNGTVRNVTATSNTLAGFNLFASRNNTVQGVTITDNADGLYFSSLGTDNVVTDSTIADNDGWAVLMDSWSGDAPTNRFENLDIGASSAPNTTLSFTGRAVAIDQISSPPADPSGRLNAGRYLNVTGIVGRSYLDLTLSYAEADDVRDESTLALFEHDDTGWTELPDSTVDTTGNELSVNFTSVPVSESYPVSNWVTLGAFSLEDSIARCTVIDSPGRYELSTNVSSGDASHCVEITASDVTLDGNGHTVDTGPGGNGVYLHGSISNVTVRNLTAANGDHGVHVAGGVSNATVDDVAVRNVGSRGIVLRGPDATVTDSLVENPGTRGFLVAENGDGATIADTTVLGGGGDRAGMRVQNDATIRNVTVRNASGHGISIVVDPRVDVFDSTVTGAGGQGIDAESGVVTVANTTVRGSAEEGIRIAAGVSIGEIRDSVVVENAGYDGGIYVSDRNVEISNVTSARNDRWGLRLGDDGTVVHDSTLRNNGAGGFYVFDATGITLTDNVITGNDGSGVRLAQGSDVSLAGDRFSGNTDASVFAGDGTVSATNVELDGTTYSFDATGVAVEPAAPTPPLPRDQVGLGTALNVSDVGSGDSFDGTLPYDESAATAAAGEDSIELWRYDAGSGWSIVDATVDTGADTVAVSTNDFSTFAPLADADLPGEEVTGCRVIDAPGRYTLAADVTNATTDACIEIATSDVTVDGNGHTVDGVDGDGIGVLSDSGTGSLSNVTVRNVTVTDWRWGLRYRQIPNVTVEDVTATSNEDIGIYLQSSPDSSVRDSTVRSSGMGVYTLGGEGVTIADTTISNSTDEGVILVDTVENATIRGNTIVDADVGVSMTPYEAGEPNGTTLRDNVIRKVRYGIDQLRATGTTSTNDTVSDATAGALRLRDGATIAATRLDVGNSTAPHTTVDVEARDVIVGRVDSAPASPANETGIGRYLNATNTTGDAYLDLGVRYDEPALGDVDETTLTLYRKEDSDWQAVPGSTVDTTRNVVGANVSTFGDFGVFGQAGSSDGEPSDGGGESDGSSSGSSAIRITDVSLSPDTVEPGERVTVTVVVSNEGDSDEIREVALLIDGETVDATTVLVAAGDRRSITFTHSFDAAGEYDVAADGVGAGTVTVRDRSDTVRTDAAPATDTSTESTSNDAASSTASRGDDAGPAPDDPGNGVGPILGVGAAIVLVAVAALLAGRRDG